MSVFDYPRLNLAGKAIMNPPTGNNDKFIPLSFYDPVSAKAALPPKLFLIMEDDKRLALEHKFHVKEIKIKSQKHQYIEIEPIKSIEVFKEWAIHPLGTYDKDKDYHALFQQVLKRLGPGSEKICPGYFNYYGNMEFEFSDLRVKSIALPSNDNKFGELIITENDSTNEKEDENLTALLNAELQINNNQRPKAKMVDSVSSMSIATQIFWDNLALVGSETFFSGKPCKAALRFINNSRIVIPVNMASAHGSSGLFVSSIPINELADSRIVDLFQKYLSKDRKLSGLQITFNLFEVREDLETREGPSAYYSNPVETTVVATISPMYNNDLRTSLVGRQLNASISYLKCTQRKNSIINDCFLSPSIAKVDYENHSIMINLINNIPEKYVRAKKGASYPKPGEKEDAYQTIPIGTIECKAFDSNSCDTLGKFQIDDGNYDREKYIYTGGMIVIKPGKKYDLSKLKNRKLALNLLDGSGKNLIGKDEDDYLMIESEYYIVTDQGSLYSEEDHDPVHGYRSFTGKKEDCIINIFRHGDPVNNAIPITIMKCEVLPWNVSYEFDYVNRRCHYKNGDKISFPVIGPFNGLFLLCASREIKMVNELESIYPDPKWIWYYIMTYYSSYVAVRILPYHDYSEFLNLHLGALRKKVTFDVLKKEIWNHYDLIYPFMTKVFPFDEISMKSFENHILKLLNIEENWEKSSYMPASRDLTENQIRLILQWLNDNKSEKGAYYETDFKEISHSSLNVHGTIHK